LRVPATKLPNARNNHQKPSLRGRLFSVRDHPLPSQNDEKTLAISVTLVLPDALEKTEDAANVDTIMAPGNRRSRNPLLF